MNLEIAVMLVLVALLMLTIQKHEAVIGLAVLDISKEMEPANIMRKPVISDNISTEILVITVSQNHQVLTTQITEHVTGAVTVDIIVMVIPASVMFSTVA